MRDDTGAGDEPTSAIGVEQFQGFYAIKQRFLSDRSKESALAILSELTALDVGEIDSYVRFIHQTVLEFSFLILEPLFLRNMGKFLI